MDQEQNNSAATTDPNLGLGPTPEIEQPKKRRFWLWFVVFDALIVTPLLILGALFYFWHLPPTNFTEQTVVIEPGSSVMSVARQLSEIGVVQSEHVLFAILRYVEDPTQIKAGTYSFTEPQTAFDVASTLTTGQFANDLISITFIEGESAAAFARRAAVQLENFDPILFTELTVGSEGRLFPETYRVPPDYTTAELVELLTDTHNDILKSFSEDIADSGLTVSEVLILASIVEREANTPESMRLVAGIFQNRLDIGMPLQADASIEYALETPLGELPPGQLATELRELDSPYNTYLNPGLPPTPIGNPGEESISAVVFPTDSDYLYYITGNDGEFYYAETYNQHLINIERHLR